MPRAAGPPQPCLPRREHHGCVQKGPTPPRVDNQDVNCAAVVPPGLASLMPGDSTAEGIYADAAKAVLALGSSLPDSASDRVRPSSRGRAAAAPTAVAHLLSPVNARFLAQADRLDPAQLWQNYPPDSPSRSAAANQARTSSCANVEPGAPPRGHASHPAPSSTESRPASTMTVCTAPHRLACAVGSQPRVDRRAAVD